MDNDHKKPLSRRTFLEGARTCAIGFAACAFKSTILSIPLSSCKKRLPDPPGGGLPTDAELADGLGFYTRIRKGAATTPLYVTLDVTPNRALDGALGAASRETMTVKELRGIIEQLAAMKVLHLSLIGNDTFADAEHVDLLKYAEKSNVSTSAAVAGLTLTDEQLDAVAAIPFFTLQVTVDGATAGTHDKLHGTGAWERTVDLLKRCKSKGIETTVVTFASQANYAEIERVIALADENGASMFHLRRYTTFDQGFKTAALAGGALQLTPKQAKDLMALQQGVSLKRAGAGSKGRGMQIVGVDPLGGTHEDFVRGGAMSQKDNPTAWNVMCQSGATYVHITATGLVTPCAWLPVLCGDLRQQPLAEIWANAPNLQVLRGRASFDECIAHAFQATGSMHSRDPLGWT